MFGVIVAGRSIQTDFQSVDQTHFVFNLLDADSINHIVVFLTGQQTFPDGYGGAVYFSWPSPDGLSLPPSWQYLGYLTNQKPSAVFRVSKLKGNESQNSNPFCSSLHKSHIAQIGISVETEVTIANMTPVSGSETSRLETFAEFSQKMLESFSNFASSFAVTQAQMQPNPQESYVPSSVVHNWYENFQRRMIVNPYFWRDSK